MARETKNGKTDKGMALTEAEVQARRAPGVKVSLRDVLVAVGEATPGYVRAQWTGTSIVRALVARFGPEDEVERRALLQAAGFGVGPRGGILGFCVKNAEDGDARRP